MENKEIVEKIIEMVKGLSLKEASAIIDQAQKKLIEIGLAMIV